MTERVEVTIKMVVELPDEWGAPPKNLYGRDNVFGTWLDSLAWDLVDHRQGPSKWYTETEGDHEGWRKIIEADVVSADIDAGDWGYYNVDEESFRMGLHIVLVPR
jgi:hypothetical protein